MGKTELRYNERSWAIDIISYINSIVQKNSPIQKASGEYSIAKDSQILFPDILLFGDQGSGNILQGWELKMPDTLIDDLELIDNARTKAQNLGLNSFLLWNAVDVRLYIFNGTAFENDTNFQIKPLPYKNRTDVFNRQDIWKKCIDEIIQKLNDYFTTGKIKAVSPDIVFSDEGIIKQFLASQAEVKAYLQEQSRKNKTIDASIKCWWRYVENDYPGYQEPYGPLAYCVIMRWFNRFVFTNVLYAYNKLPESNDLINTDMSVQKALDIYRSICTKYDYWNILGPSSFDDMLPDNVWSRLLNIYNFMHGFEFAKINKNILSAIIKSTVLTSIKKVAGLYSTPTYIAELLVRLALNDKDGNTIDPFCGTGTIVKQIFNIKGEYNIDGRSALETTWASDKFAFPIQVATLAISASEVITESLHIFTKDAFTLKVGDDITFTDPSNGQQKTYKLPQFSSIISNFPFVQFENIAELNPEVKVRINDFYKKYKVAKQDQLDSRCDIYAYIPFLLYELLNDDGYMGFIISNSWIATKAGKAFRRLLIQFYDIEYIVTSGAGRWFENTRVVTNLVVCKKRNANQTYSASPSFITVIIPLNDESDIEKIATDIISANTSSENTVINQFSKDEIANIEKLGLGYNCCFGSVHWLTDNIDKFALLSNYAKISRGERRGWDPLFYPNATAASGIEDEYLYPVLKTSKGKFEYIIEADSFAFCCNSSIDYLIEHNKIGALSWIRNFKNSVNEKGKPLVDVLARKGLYWYQISVSSLATFILAMNPDSKIFVQRFLKPSFVNQRLINITPLDDNADLDLFHALLNSTIVISQIEALGFGRGESVLDINPTNLATGLYIPRIEAISDKQKKEIVNSFANIMKEPVMSVEEILKSSLRREYDELIFKSMGIPVSVIGDVYKNLARLYTIRKAVNFTVKEFNT
jgi:hypothetical protein